MFSHQLHQVGGGASQDIFFIRLSREPFFCVCLLLFCLFLSALYCFNEFTFSGLGCTTARLGKFKSILWWMDVLIFTIRGTLKIPWWNRLIRSKCKQAVISVLENCSPFSSPGSKLVPFWSWLQMGRDLIFIRLRYLTGAWKLEPPRKTD